MFVGVVCLLFIVPCLTAASTSIHRPNLAPGSFADVCWRRRSWPKISVTCVRPSCDLRHPANREETENWLCSQRTDKVGAAPWTPIAPISQQDRSGMFFGNKNQNQTWGNVGQRSETQVSHIIMCISKLSTCKDSSLHFSIALSATQWGASFGLWSLQSCLI